MPTVAIIGAQWGDEGKGKITDYLAEEADAVVRFQGGNNAGHTIVIGDSVFKLHLLPSGVLRKDKLAVIGNGVVVNFADMAEEVKQIEDAGLGIDGLRISDRAHLIMNYHKKLDGAEEVYRGNASVGTTKKGIGPTYQDKIARYGFRAGDLLEPELVREKTKFLLPMKKDLMKLMGSETCCCTEEDFAERLIGWGQKYGKYICDTSVLINDMLDEGKNVLFEGAQGAMLDIDHGTYPYVTSSSTVGGGICSGAGVAPNRIQKVVGCLKAYTTRVGEGPFVTELEGAEEEELQRKGGEFGVTTGRGRRCGWLDLVVAEHAARLCGITSWAITKLDVLNGYDKIKVCVGYEIDGKVEKHFPASIAKLERAKPVYEEFDGWEDWEDSEALVSAGMDSLPENMQKYIRFIEEYTGIPADIISIGPKRSETIDRTSGWWN
ncbi:MAG: adenylosuccinate synthase [Candidatus Methanomethylophilaceae archaeon]